MFEIKSTPQTELIVISGKENPIQGWVSKQYGEKQPAPVLVNAGYEILPVTIDTMIFPKNIGQDNLFARRKKLKDILGG